MPIDAKEPNSPGWWFEKLYKELGKRQARYNKLDRYYNGDPDLPEGAEGAAEAYRQFQRKSRSNFAGLIVDAVLDRMRPTGFRSGAKGSPETDARAWELWQANALDVHAPRVHASMLSMSDAYAIVGPGENGPVITAEDPRQVITAHDPLRRQNVIAALKVYRDEWGKQDVSYLYLPGRVYKATKRVSSSSTSISYVNITGWEPVETGDGQQYEELGFPVVPVVRFPNRANLVGDTKGEFEDVLDVLDRINHMLLQRIVVATVQAFRQRAIKGVPMKDAKGKAIDYNTVFTADPGALWLLPKDAELWESGLVDLTPLLSSVKDDIQQLAAISRTPLYVFQPDAANQSAEGATLAREGIVFKTEDRIVDASESWERVMQLAFLLDGQADDARTDMEVLWAPVERFSLAERADAASKAITAGIPWETVMSDIMQFSPQQVERMRAERTSDLALAAAFAPAPPAPPTNQGPAGAPPAG